MNVIADSASQNTSICHWKVEEDMALEERGGTVEEEQIGNCPVSPSMLIHARKSCKATEGQNYPPMHMHSKGYDSCHVCLCVCLGCPLSLFLYSALLCI